MEPKECDKILKQYNQHLAEDLFEKTRKEIRNNMNRDFGNGALWAVATILLAMLFSFFIHHETCYNPGIVLGTLFVGLYFRFRRGPYDPQNY